MSHTPAALLESNRKWAEEFERRYPGRLQQIASKHEPPALWIGCVDARVPESVVLNVDPGVVFTHRNIANQFKIEDDNARSMLDYGVGYLGVRHVYVVGHTGCGGVSAAYDAAKQLKTGGPEPVDRWLRELVQLVLEHNLHLIDKETALPLITRLNVLSQVNNVCKTKVVHQAAKEGRFVNVHGLLYTMATGRLLDLECSKTPGRNA